jgi:hypothetical protein
MLELQNKVRIVGEERAPTFGTKPPYELLAHTPVVSRRSILARAKNIKCDVKSLLQLREI